MELNSFVQTECFSLASKENNTGSPSEIFYDGAQKAFLYREKELVTLVQGGEHRKIFRIPYEKKIFDISVSRNHRYIAYSIADNILVILSFADGREQRIKMQSSSDGFLKSKQTAQKSQTILFFSWIDQQCPDPNVDFILCERSGIRLYKLAEDKIILKEQKVYDIQCSACWYDPTGQTLLVASLKENGKLFTFFFGERKHQLKYKGPEFYVEDMKREKKSADIFIKLLTSMTQMLGAENPLEKTTSSGRISVESLWSKFSQAQVRCEEQCDCQVFLLNIYMKTYLIFVDQVEGKIFLYHLLYEKITKLDLKISVPSDSLVSVCIVEDLLVVNSHQNQISMIFDIKRSNQTIPIGPPQPIILVPDNKLIYETSVLLMGDEWIFDSETQKMFRFIVRLELVHDIVEGEIECFNIILRRNNPKQESIKFIKSGIKQQKKITHICTYFKHIFAIYKEAQKEKTIQDQSLQTDSQRTPNKSTSSNLKIKQGYTVIFPSELLQELLIPVVNDNSIPRSYIIAILSEYLQLAYSNGIVSLIKTQDLLVDIILKEQDYNNLHAMLQFNGLEDSSELAKKLIALSIPQNRHQADYPRKAKPYKAGFQLGVDMMFRLKKHVELVEILFSFGMFLEAMDLIQRVNLYGKLKAKNIALWSCENQGNCRRSEVIRFFEYLMSSPQYLSVSSNSSSSSQANNKLQFTLSQLKDEFDKAKKRSVSTEKSRNYPAQMPEDSLSPRKDMNIHENKISLDGDMPQSNRLFLQPIDCQSQSEIGQITNNFIRHESIKKSQQSLQGDTQKSNFIENEESLQGADQQDILFSKNEEQSQDNTLTN